MLPSAIVTALADIELSALPGVPVLDDQRCQGAEFHSPTPLTLYRVDDYLLCGTCCANYRVLRTLLERHGADLSWEVRRSFGNRLRALVIPKEGR